MLLVVAFRNLIELSGSSFNFSEGFALPKSFGWFRGNNVLWTISYVRTPLLSIHPRKDLHTVQPVLSVMTSEMIVDWLKHAFITKFNHIRPSVYERYTDVLCRDLASGSAVGRRGARKVRIARLPAYSSLPDDAPSILTSTSLRWSRAASASHPCHWPCSRSSLAHNLSVS